MNMIHDDAATETEIAAENLAHAREVADRLVAGDFSDVPPWLTVEDVVREVNNTESRYGRMFPRA